LTSSQTKQSNFLLRQEVTLIEKKEEEKLHTKKMLGWTYYDKQLIILPGVSR
jgi:hypothetical protein